MTKELSLELYKNDNIEFKIDKIDYTDNNDNNDVIKFEYEDISYSIYDNNFIRENKEFLFKLDILKKECIYTLKETNTTLSIMVVDSSITKENNEITIMYELETEPITNKIIIKLL